MFIQQSLFDHNQFDHVSEVGGRAAATGALGVCDSTVNGSIGKQEGGPWKLAWQAVLFVVNLYEDLNTILSSLALMTSSWGIHKPGWLAACLVSVLMSIVVFARNRKLLRDIYEWRTLVALLHLADFDLVYVFILVSCLWP